MYYLVHLALPAIAAVIMAVSHTPFELSLSSLSLTTEKALQCYMFLAAPHWIWAAISGYFDASKSATVGGFIGGHILLIAVWLIVARSGENNSANGWLIYLLGAPILIAIGAIVGKCFTSWQIRKKA